MLVSQFTVVMQLMLILISQLLTILIYKLTTLKQNGIKIELTKILVKEWYYLLNMRYKAISKVGKCG